MPQKQAQLAAHPVPGNQREVCLRGGRAARQARVHADRAPRQRHRRFQVDFCAQHDQVALRGPEEKGAVPALQFPGWSSHVGCWKAGCKARRPQGHLAVQRTLPPHTGELQRIHRLPQGQQRRSNERQGTDDCNLILSPF
jgi:hypothetical protein